MSDIRVPVSPGELLDKVTILRLKRDRITDPEKSANVRHELSVLEAIVAGQLRPDPVLDSLVDELFAVNAALWTIEDDIRACDAAGDFGAGFVALARSVYQQNDRRAAIKKRINLHLGSSIVEEKSYHQHGGAGAPP